MYQLFHLFQQKIEKKVDLENPIARCSSYKKLKNIKDINSIIDADSLKALKTV